MMWKINNLRLLILLIFGLTIVVSAFSCSQLPTGSTTSTTATDLSRFINSDPSIVDNSQLPVTPVEDLHVTGIDPSVDVMKYRLTVDGLIDNQLSLTYEAIMQYPAVTEVVLLICPGVFVDNAEWTGVPVSAILAEAGVEPQANNVIFHAADGYQITLSLELVRGDGVFLAYAVDGQTLPKEHGYPLRLVVKGLYGNTWVKWITDIEITG